MIKFEELISVFTDLGLKSEDVVLLHSSYFALGEVEGGPKTVIDAILEIITSEGTLIAPTYNWDFCKGKTFNIKKTPSKCGIISEIVRKDPKSKRVLHPIYSHSIIGKLKNEIGNMRYKSSFGKDSVFAKLRELDGKILIIGLPFILSNTFAHHVEEMLKVDYRFLKEFRGKIIDENNQEYEDSFLMNVKPMDGTQETYFEDFENLMDNEKITKIRKINNCTIKIMNSNEIFERLSKEIKNNPSFLYKQIKK